MAFLDVFCFIMNNMKKKQEHTSLFNPELASFYDVAIIGGGASGLTAAIAAAQQAEQLGREGLRIAVFESGKRIGSSILRSGNGRCNFSHTALSAQPYWNKSFVEKAFAALDNHPYDKRFENGVLAWFYELGLTWSEAENTGGLLYPFSNKASSVLDVLRLALDAFSIEVFVETPVAEIASRNNSSKNNKQRFEVLFKDGSSVGTTSVVLACGGNPDCLLVGGHSCTSTRPVLGPLKTDTTHLKGLNGIRVRARVSLDSGSFTEEGEVLFREYGVSGIVIFNASRYAEKGSVLSLDFVPDMATEELTTWLEERFAVLQPCSWKNFLTGFLLSQVAAVVLERAGLDAEDVPSREGLGALARTLKDFRLVVQGIADPKQCQVSRGGLLPDSFSHETMESQVLAGFYALGECLDIDGPCGGYNLHWAWASGLLAGRAIANGDGLQGGGAC